MSCLELLHALSSIQELDTRKSFHHMTVETILQCRTPSTHSLLESTTGLSTQRWDWIIWFDESSLPLKTGILLKSNTEHTSRDSQPHCLSSDIFKMKSSKNIFLILWRLSNFLESMWSDGMVCVKCFQFVICRLGDCVGLYISSHPSHSCLLPVAKQFSNLLAKCQWGARLDRGSWTLSALSLRRGTTERHLISFIWRHSQPSHSGPGALSSLPTLAGRKTWYKYCPFSTCCDVRC